MVVIADVVVSTIKSSTAVSGATTCLIATHSNISDKNPMVIAPVERKNAHYSRF